MVKLLKYKSFVSTEVSDQLVCQLTTEQKFPYMFWTTKYSTLCWMAVYVSVYVYTVVCFQCYDNLTFCIRLHFLLVDILRYSQN